MSGDWQNNFKFISERALHIYNNKLLCDCEFLLGKYQIKSHKLILAMGSPVFQAMFYGSNPEPPGPIKIPDIDPIVFQQIIEYIYSNELKIENYKNACDLYYGAKKYLLSFMERDCVEYLKTNLTVENVLDLYEFAKYHNEEDLEKQCLMEVQLKTEEILEGVNLFNISEDTLTAILDLNAMNISSELVLFNAVEKWAHHNLGGDDTNSVKLEECINLLKKLRFLTLTIEEFAEGPAKSKFLSDFQKLTILLRISGAVKEPMENGFSELKKQRKPANFKSMSILDITELQSARCDGSEWLTSIFKTNVSIDLLGVEIRLQINDLPGNYVENIMIKVSYANSADHFLEASLCGIVSYNSKWQVMFNQPCPLDPDQEYAIHIFLCRPGMYPIGRHSNLTCTNQSVVIEFVSHSSWERAHPYNTTVISSIIYSELNDD